MTEAQKLKRGTYHLWTFMTSKLISTFGANVYSFAISFYILQLTGSATNFALNLICSILPRTIAAPFAGYVADNFSRKRTIILAQASSVLAIAGLLTVSLMNGLSLTAIYITTCLLSLTSTFSGITFTSSISGLVDENRIQKAMSLNQMSISLASIVAPALGGVLYGAVSIPVFLIIYLIASLVALILDSTMDFQLFAKRSHVPVAGQEKEKLWVSMKEGFAYLKTKPVIQTIIFIALFINFFFGSFQVGYSFVLIEKLGMKSEHFGILEGAFAVGMLLLSFYLTIRKEIKYPLITAKYGTIGLALVIGGIAVPLLVPFSYQAMFVFYLILMLAIGSFLTIINTPIGVMMQKSVDDDFKGRVISILETMAQVLMPLGTVIYGFLYDWVAAEWVLFISAGIIIGIALFMLRPSVIANAYPERKNALQRITG
ncbi:MULTISPECIES: MFS transporter [Bacillaceae]|uniref:Multidrug resistance protein n=1 Tax=Caldibacillus thermoamylovorans TaxID=35841 RepID=A0A090IQV2_9BACI|nr:MULTISPECIES: MFS transporter [Bacillaceae]MCM3056068.1 MFS transporter [Caldibacillus thermoamylovorans]MEC5272036.1 MFS transporter [Caldifermentibacillus hisashii]CEE00426.1 multidrug resistance protein [Caldibacillus thermoamylovorans]